MFFIRLFHAYPVPELPEVETARKYVHNHLLHAKVVRVEVLDPHMLQDCAPIDLGRKVRGRQVIGTGRHGKNLFVSFEDGVLHIHLGMSGSLSFHGDPDRHSSHERMRLLMDNGVMVLDDPRRFGRFGWVRKMDDLISKKALGPDALAVSEDEFVERLMGRRASLKSILLDQRHIAGLGNLYVDEVLFQQRLHPTTPLSSVSCEELRGLWARTREVLCSSIEVGTDFRRLPKGYLLRQREKGGMCPRCGAGLDRAVVAGRTSVFCPICQGRGLKS